MIDLDASLYVEYDDATKDVLALIETAIDRGQEYKPATVTTKLAMRCTPSVPAYVLLYTLSKERQNPADSRWPDIEQFRVKRLWPKPEQEWRTLTPQQWAESLLRLRKWAASRLDDAFLEAS